MGLKLWLISQDVNTGYDTYDNAVVVAESEREARYVHPGGYAWISGKWGKRRDDGSIFHPFGGDWADPEHVTVKSVGIADEGYAGGEVVCASFNAG